ncbi:T-cell acute lymphocytic leukemia protein 1 homolog [Canis lupus dingo]|uniref:T-cell acute lymphocytic leukemia protein 1 homolog n=1 Tax=Canis lupus dingo TaxID=286419 RepID=UPI0020C2C26D|nr:T-cell acute lymphocytic leukemia protein 1 homolog [Canis lupus dingo]
MKLEGSALGLGPCSLGSIYYPGQVFRERCHVAREEHPALLRIQDQPTYFSQGQDKVLKTSLLGCSRFLSHCTHEEGPSSVQADVLLLGSVLCSTPATPCTTSLYIGPAGPFGIFPSSRLKRRPSHCELELAVGHQPQKVAPRVFTDSGERRRQQNVNGAFAELRKLLPTHLPDPNPDPAEQERGSPLGHEIHWLPGAQPGPKTAGAPSPTPGLPLRSLSQAPASPSSCVSASLSASLVNK